MIIIQRVGRPEKVLNYLRVLHFLLHPDNLHQKSQQLHYVSCWLISPYGAPSKARTCGLLLRRQALYPTELWARRQVFYHKGPGAVESSQGWAAIPQVLATLPVFYGHPVIFRPFYLPHRAISVVQGRGCAPLYRWERQAYPLPGFRHEKRGGVRCVVRRRGFYPGFRSTA